MSKYVAYYRVSTHKQALGLDAQRARVHHFAGNAPIIAEYSEKESGKTPKRPELAKAITAAERMGATLVVAKLDRLSRDVSFIFELHRRLERSNIQLAATDIPELSTLTLGLYATLAQHERELISERTSAALQAKKANGFKLGSPQNLTYEASLKGAKATKDAARANENNKRASGYIMMLRNAGHTFRAIATILNNEGFVTARGKQYSSGRVKLLYDRVLADAENALR